jgi:colanic acid biosynthesis glycosyl transferase WcaI
MRVLFLAQHYAPEQVSGAVLATELAEGLAQRGHDVVLVTCAPSYPQGRVFAGYRNRMFQVEDLDGVRVVRTWSYISPRQANWRSFWRRILSYGTFSASALYGGLLAMRRRRAESPLAGRPDLVFSYSPPLPLGITAWLLSRFWRVPWVLRVEDLYPEAAVAVGALCNRVAIRLFFALERFLYHEATHVSLISEGFRQNLQGKGIPAGKLSVIPVWADPEVIRPEAKENGFRRQYDLQGTFLIMYAGTLGLTSALEDVVQAAYHLKDYSDVRFMMIGEGVKKETLVNMARQQGLENMTFLPFQPRETLSEVMAAADVSLVTLNRASSPFSLPNKVFSIMASGRPILAVTPPESEVAQLIQAGECGVIVPPGEPDSLAGTILDLRSNPGRLERLGENGRALLESHFSRQQCVDRYEEMLQQVLA